MKEFMVIFRNDKDEPKPSPEELQGMLKQWDDWIGGIAAQEKFVATNALGFEGKTVSDKGVVSDGPYSEIKEIIGGYLICKTDTLEDAVVLTKGCPILANGGTVEVRDVMVFDV